MVGSTNQIRNIMAHKMQLKEQLSEKSLERPRDKRIQAQVE